jgi:N-acetylglucosamine transport system substrate-binding protein
VLTVVQGSTEGLTLSPGLASSSKVLADAGANNFSFRWDSWYKKMDDECRSATNELMFQGGTAEKFAQRMQTVADAVKADSSIEKFER